MLAHLDGGWEQHSRHQLTQVWDSPELAGRVFDAYLCVTEYVLTAGDPYDRVAGFAKRLRAQAHQAGARRGEAFAATVLGETELFTDNLEAARAHLVDAARLSREVGAVGGESLARMRLGEALLHLGDRAGARAQLEEALELAHISPLPQHLLFLVYGVLLQVPDESAEALALIERAETLFDPRWVCQILPHGLPRRRGEGVRARRPARARPRVPGARRAGRRRLAGRPLAGGGGGGARRAAARRGRPARCGGRPAPRRRGLRRGGTAARRAAGPRRAEIAPQSGNQRLGRFREGLPARLPACQYVHPAIPPTRKWVVAPMPRKRLGRGCAQPHNDRGGLEVSVVTDTIRNGVDTEKMFATLDLIKAQPELAKFQFRATNRWIDGSHNRSTIKGFYAAGGEDTTRSEEFEIDAGEPAILLGTDTGANPAEYLLHALAACLTTSIVYVAAARKVELTSVESTLTGDMDVRGALGVDDEPRNGFERIGVSFRVTGNAPEEKLREVVERAQKRSAVYDMVTNGVPVAVEVTTD